MMAVVKLALSAAALILLILSILYAHDGNIVTALDLSYLAFASSVSATLISDIFRIRED